MGPKKDKAVIPPPQVQRTPFFAPAVPVPSAADDSSRRAFVEDARTYIRSAAEFYQLAKLDQPTVDKILPRWMEMEANTESIIAAIEGGGTAATPSGDAALLEATRKDYAAAIRSLLTRASVQLGKPLIRLYLENMYQLPSWAWPDSGIFIGGDEKQKQDYARDFAIALQDATLFSGYATLDGPHLEEALGRLKTLVDDTQVMIAGQLGNDNSLRDSLRQGYRGAVKALLRRASIALKSSEFSLFMKYRYGGNPLIHPWAEDVFPNITATLPQGTPGPDPTTGEVSFMLNGFRVALLPDGTSKGGTHTEAHLDFVKPTCNITGNTVTGIDPVQAPVIQIHTEYAPTDSAGATSAYGRGTTESDQRHGDTTLGFHEGNHATDYLSYIAAHPAPDFGGTVGSTVNAFDAAVAAWSAALITYVTTMRRGSELVTDCVGRPTIVGFYRTQGKASPVACPK